MADPQTLAELNVRVAAALGDTGAAYGTYTSALIDDCCKRAASLIHKRQPRSVTETRHTVADTRELNLAICNLIDIHWAEYKTGKNPRWIRGIRRKHGTIWELEVESRPSSAVDVYLSCSKTHTLVEDISDKTGAIDLGAGYAAGLTTIHVDALADVLIPQGALLTVAGRHGEYRVMADVTASGNEADITIEPPVIEALVDDDVVTFVCSTLEPAQEDAVVEIASGLAMATYWETQINASNTGGRSAPDKYIARGERKVYEGLMMLPLWNKNRERYAEE